ncbi:hypothetical protein OG285_31815 [Streptomyces sp. NBC_01471]|uniref:hypothetical protein n=1 Tax=Streptomyces sp. NBC_01471 TaxID=2903879 RepID=UPI003252A086
MHTIEVGGGVCLIGSGHLRLPDLSNRRPGMNWQAFPADRGMSEWMCMQNERMTRSARLPAESDPRTDPDDGTSMEL